MAQTEKTPDRTEESPSFIFVLFLLATAFLCGAIVMVVEVLGSRVIGPFFGVSLFVWTSLITVTLVALAAGYAIGGVLSDRLKKPDYLYALILAAGVLVMAVPLIRAPVLKAALPLGLRAGSLVSSLLLFGPALLLLGCVSPYIIKLAAREMRNIGRTVGLFYSLSTLGSFVGTVLTGFFLITLFGVDRIFLFTGGLLVSLAVLYFAAFRRRWPALLLLLLPLLPWGGRDPLPVERPDGTQISVVYDRDSFYGNIKVIDFRRGSVHHREMAIDGFIQSGVDMRTRQSVYAYPYLLQLLPAALNPDGRTCLVVGLGAGIVPMWYESRGASVDVVDIDPEIVNVARTHFGFRTSGRVHLADARYFLQSSTSRYDYLIMDVFSGDTTPGHLLSLEALQLAGERISPGGVFAANIVGTLGEDAFMTASIVRTVREVFDTVECYPVFDPKGTGGYGNIVIVGYNGLPRSLDPALLRTFRFHPSVAGELRSFREWKHACADEGPSMILTDDFNPIDFYDLPLKESIRTDILRSTDAGILL